MSITENELREIEKRAERATKGPWVIISIDDVFAYVCFDSLPYKVAEVLSLRDAEFIAHAREDVPRLVSEVRRLREILRQKELREKAAYGEIECPDCGYPLSPGQHDSLICTQPGCGYSGIPTKALKAMNER